MPTVREGQHKGTAGDAAAHHVPRGHREHHGDREHVEEDEPKRDGAHGARNGLFGLRRLAGGDADDLYSHVAGEREAHGKPDTFQAVGKKASMGGEI